MKKALNLGVIGIDHGHIFDMLDEMLKEGCTCDHFWTCLLYTSPSPRDRQKSRMPSSA